MEYSSKEIVGAAVCALMKSQKRDEKFLAEKLGTTTNYVYKLKKGHHVSLMKCQEIAGLFGCKLSDFFKVGEIALEKAK